MGTVTIAFMVQSLGRARPPRILGCGFVLGVGLRIEILVSWLRRRARDGFRGASRVVA